MKYGKRFGRAVSVLLALSILSAIFPACSTQRLHAYSATYIDETFDTVLTMTIGAQNAAEANTHLRKIKALVSDLHRHFQAYSTYSDRNNIATINAAESGTSIKVCDDVLSLLMLGREVYEKTGGTVHIGLGSVTELWKDAIAAEAVPAPEQIAEAMMAVSPLDNLLLDTKAGTVTRTDSHMKLDVGAIAKGYVLDKVCAYAAEAQIESLLVNLGGEILAVGSAPNGKPWEVAIADPDGGLIQTIHVRNAVVATGGDYERGFEANGKRYHHIIDPATGYPAVTHRAATVLVPLEAAALSDAYSTALLILPDNHARELASTVPGMQYLLVHPDGTLVLSDGWEDNTP